MNIQVVSYDKQLINCIGHNIDCSTFGAPKAFDSYDVNIIDLQNEKIWENNGNSNNSINCISDFESLNKQIKVNKKSQIIVLFPPNCDYYYNSSISSGYYKVLPLKDMLVTMNKYIVSALVGGGWSAHYELIFGLTKTKFKNSEWNADFYFNTSIFKGLTESQTSKSKTTVRVNDKIVFSTLIFDSFDKQLCDFLEYIGIYKKKEDIPEWLKEIEFLNDAQQIEIIEIAKKEIENLHQRIENANVQLESNRWYKRSLIDNGQQLVNIVFDMLEKMLGCDLSDFEDEKKEDFLIKLKNVTFIGEIKGITSNIKSENVSQVDVHYQSYLDKLREDNVVEEVKPILIINSFRTKPITEREEVHHIQIDLAIRNGSLIITTYELLKLFETFLKNKTTSSKIIEVFKTKTGLFSVNDCLIIEEDNSPYMI